ncbi:sulfur carrier protein ThiS [Chromatium okenii]|jgi:sulfur carrier protein|uniref:Thiamine biosynthesis protein ThiS n=1 Tax=Chromatium okenii TaxID=61644 RepID=A0A2S7XPQ7_9GAMM|nr:sulfur carrier protein ThiS [Chromatium okenii]MBV5309542.1 sulfur carrier protein ThiS [Chromatium okenii]PQJ95727.1 thiamine biosynthesis protein ThiS [Chromatium okenii]
MHIVLNGTSTEISDHSTLADLVAQLALTGQRLAIEVNAELVPRSTFTDHLLAPDDRVEIIHAVGGG